MAESEETRLLSVAESISEGRHINWDEVSAPTLNPEDTPLLDQLRLLDRIATFHRSTEPSALPTDPSDVNPPEEDREDDLRAWGHLAVLEKNR